MDEIHEGLTNDRAFEVYAVDGEAGDRLARELQAGGLQPTEIVEYRALDMRNPGTFAERTPSQLYPQSETVTRCDPSQWMREYAPAPGEQPSVDEPGAVGAAPSKLFEPQRDAALERVDRAQRELDGVRDFIRQSYAHEHGHRGTPGTSASVTPTVRAERNRPPTLER